MPYDSVKNKYINQCQARAEGDQYRCALCRIVWDRNDPEPPKCPQEEKINSAPKQITKLPDEATDESFGYVKTLP
jgi:hypothetical protein